jgi:hypothetical protein
MKLVRADPALRSELESLGTPQGGLQESKPRGEASHWLLPDIEPFDRLTESEFVLLAFMHYWSEELRASRWYGELEYFLTTVGPDTADTPKTKNFQEAYRALVDHAGGWFTHGRDGRKFVPGTYADLLEGATRCRTRTDYRRK